MLSRSTTLRVGCKINLYLRVGDRLPNGYHELDTMFVPLREPHDILEIFQDDAGMGDSVTGETAGIRVEFSVPGIDPERNTLTKAYAWYASLTAFSPALRIAVEKNIPHGAGLGGGSADAAALLLYLQEEAAKAGYSPLAEAELLEKSTAIGADVPFFLMGTAAKASGIGEKLVPVPNPCAGHFLVLVCPNVHVSTAWAFKALDERRSGADGGETGGGLHLSNSGIQKIEKSRANGLTSAGHQATYLLARGSLYGNDFEDLVFARLPQLAALQSRLYAAGAEVVRMSGTGSSIFALFGNETGAKETAKTLASDGLKVYMQAL